MCGLLGHLGNEKNKVNIDKLNILGILNETRGTDSCGIAMDGEIAKGVTVVKKYRDFVSVYKLYAPKFTTGIIGHTRKGTGGAFTEENAHPFGFGSLKIKGKKDLVYEMVGAHNGSLINHVDLAQKRDISLTKEIEEIEESEINGKKVTKTKVKTVTKIDSEILLECLYKDKNYSVLEEYNGAAALIWQDINKPDTMFFYHGASKKDEFDKEIQEERPLFYWRQGPYSMYVSSIEDSLFIIGGDRDSIHEFEFNTVYEVKNGNINKAKKTLIDRSKCWKNKTYNFQRGRRGNHNYSHMGGRNNNITTPRNRQNARVAGFSEETFIPNTGSAHQLQLNLERPLDKGLLAETFDFDPNLNRGLTVCKQLRYWRNGHKAEGVFSYVQGHGFLFLGQTQKDALNRLSELAGVGFWHKEFQKNISVKVMPNEGFIPYTREAINENAIGHLHYMFKGIRYKTYTDWLAAKEYEGTNIKFCIISLSIGAAHPIIDIDSSDRTPGAYFEGTLAEDSYQFLGSKKVYTFKAGQLSDLDYLPGYTPEVLEDKPYYSLESATAFLENSMKVNGYANLEEKELLKELVSLDEVILKLKERDPKEVKIISEENEKTINNILLNQFAKEKISYEDAMEDLRPYAKHSTKARLAFEILDKLDKIPS